MVDSRPVTGIAAEQHGVGAMQSGDDAWLLLWRQHGTGENRRGGMRHRVVNMKNVELVVAAHFCHFYRKRQCVVGILEQSVIIDHHRVEIQARSIHWHSERPPVADEMHLMSASRQFFAERRGQNPASPNGRVTSDPNLQSMT